MVDIISLTSLIVQCVQLCGSAVLRLQTFSGQAQDAPEEIANLLRRVESIRSYHLSVQKLVAETSGAASFPVDVAGYRLLLVKLQSTMDTILKHAGRYAQGKDKIAMFKKIMWALNRSDTRKLMRELETREVEAKHVVDLISLATAGAIHSILLRTTTLDAFPTRSPHDPDEASMSGLSIASTLATEQSVMWLGHTQTCRFEAAYEAAYVALRSSIADAAKYARWEELFNLLGTARQRYGENLVNSVRMKSSEGQLISHWTPLHQAAYMHAPIRVVERLISLGASKLLRTQWSEFRHPDMLPLDVAEQVGCAAEVRTALQPTYRSMLPRDVLENLEAKFHDLIWRHLGDQVEREELRLPLLEPLLEERSPETAFFPVHFARGGGMDKTCSTGYHYRLDGRVLLVRAVNIPFDEESINYLITYLDEEPCETDELLMLNVETESVEAGNPSP